MGKEFELKFAVPNQESRRRILNYLSDGAHITEMSTTYFDTADGDLSKRKWTLRLREENNIPVVTFKTAGDGKNRGEWECIAHDLSAGIWKLVKNGAPEELIGLVSGGVHPVCGAIFLRRAVNVGAMGSLVELAFDEGKLFKGDRELPICEVEVELKEGREEDAESFARWLTEFAGLVEEKKSKFVRAVNL